MNTILAQSDNQSFDIDNDAFQQSFETQYNTTSVNEGLLSGLGVGAGLVGLVFLVIMLVSMWKIFTKAGRPGWHSLVPFYNVWVLFEIAGKPGWWGLLAIFISFIPFLGTVVSIVLSVLLAIGLSRRFGKSDGYAALLILLPFIGYPMLAFGDATYHADEVGASIDNNANQQPQQPAQPLATQAPVQPQGQMQPQQQPQTDSPEVTAVAPQQQSPDIQQQSDQAVSPDEPLNQ